MKNFILLICLLTAINLQAQQEPLTTHFWNNYAHFNPATSALKYTTQAAITYRNQWVGTKGAPQTVFANYNKSLNRYLAGGINYSYDFIDNSKKHQVSANINWRFKISQTNTISIGISPSFQYSQIESNWVFPGMPEDQFTSIINNQNLTFNGGIALKNKKIMAGIGVTQITDLYTKSNAAVTFSSAPHLFAHIQGKILLTRIHHLILAGLYRTDFVKNGFETNLRWKFRNKFLVGVGYRSDDAIIANVGWIFEGGFQLGYSFDSNRILNKLGTLSHGSHEVSLIYRLQQSGRNYSRSHSISF